MVPQEGVTLSDWQSDAHCKKTAWYRRVPLTQAAADQGVPPGQQHQLLNLGLILMGFGHVAILAPLWSTAEAGPLLHHIVAFWGTVGAIGTFGGLSGIRSNPPPDVNA